MPSGKGTLVESVMSSIEVKNLLRVYRKSVPDPQRRGFLRRFRQVAREVVALDRISFTVRKGEFFGVLGPNGAGKTTLIKILCGLLLPTAGDVFVNGRDAVSEINAVRPSVGVTLGGERAMYWPLSGRENLWFSARMYDIPDRVARPRIEELLKLTGLEKQADVVVEKYSRGMKQRLLIAKSLIHDPPVLLLDEPTVGLDPATARQIREFLRNELCTSRGKTIVLTTHYIEEADRLCDRVLILHRGKVIALDDPSELKKKYADVQTYRVTASGLEQSDIDRLKKLPDAVRVDVRYTDPNVGRGDLTVQARPDEGFVGELVNSLTQAGVKVIAVERIEKTLEDVFIDLTGSERQLA